MWALILVFGMLLIVCSLILRQSSHELKYSILHPTVNMKTLEPIDLMYPPISIDGQMCIAGQRVLVSHQHNRVENGLYKIVGSNQWVRSEDVVCDGDCIWVLNGIQNKGTLWFIVFEQGEPVQGPQPIQVIPAMKHALAATVLTERAIEFHTTPKQDGLYSLNVTLGPDAGYQSLVVCRNGKYATIEETRWGKQPPKVQCKHGNMLIHDGEITWRKHGVS